MSASELDDSIRSAKKSHRKPDVAGGIADRIAEQRATLGPSGGEFETRESTSTDPQDEARRSMEDSLPLSPSKAAAMGLTSILPPMKVKDDDRFRRFLLEIIDPDLRFKYPTYTSLSEHFGVSVQRLKTWLLSEETSKALAIGLSHEARLMMPSILRSVRIRAELTGDPHSAEFVRKVAKLGTAETDASNSFEQTLRSIAQARQEQQPKLVAAKVVDVKVVTVG